MTFNISTFGSFFGRASDKRGGGRCLGRPLLACLEARARCVGGLPSQRKTTPEDSPRLSSLRRPNNSSRLSDQHEGLLPRPFIFKLQVEAALAVPRSFQCCVPVPN